MKYELPTSPSLNKFLTKYKEFKELAISLGIDIKSMEVDFVTKEGKKLIKEIEARQALKRA